MNPPRFEDERPTRPTQPKLRAVAPTAPASETRELAANADPLSLEELIGKCMAATNQNTAVVEALSVQVGVLTTKLEQHSQASDQRRDEIKQATVKAAAHGSNRLALLLGALVTVYEVASPILHELAKWVHQ
jgi:hypothetical protein